MSAHRMASLRAAVPICTPPDRLYRPLQLHQHQNATKGSPLGSGRPSPRRFKIVFSIALPVRDQYDTRVSKAATVPATSILILGASIAGMLAAAAVSSFVDEVVLIDKDSMLEEFSTEEELRMELSYGVSKLAEQAKMRKGVPQYIQPHGLLCRAALTTELLLPGWRALAERLGGRITLPGRIKTVRPCMELLYKGRWMHVPEDPTGLITMAASRALLESSIRMRLLSTSPNVHIRSRCWAAAPLWSADKSCIEGVVTKAGQEFRADLVIDATGRRSPLPGWLAAGGYTPPQKVEVDPHITYSSRLYKMPPQGEAQNTWDVLYIRPSAPTTRGGMLQKIENDISLCCLWGYSGLVPPNDDQGFLDFAATLESKEVYEEIKSAEPLTAPAMYAGMTNLRRLYERTAMPGRLAVIGDSLAGFNPVYGQGMCVAAIEAETLQQLLQDAQSKADGGRVTAVQLGSLAGPFQAKAGQIVDFPFSVSSGEDMKYEATTGERPKKGLAERLLGTYVDDLQKLSCNDMAAFYAVQQVMNMMATPDALIRARLIAKVVRMRIAEAFTGQT